METDEIVARVVIALFALLGIAFFVNTARCAEPSLEDRLVAAQHLYGVQNLKEPATDERALAHAIVSHAVNPTHAALMLATAASETGLRARIAEDHCKPKECDRGRAVGLWQSHFLEHGAPLETQAQAAAKELLRATKECSGKVPFPLGAFRSYGSGAGCFGPVPRETERVELFRRILRVVQ